MALHPKRSGPPRRHHESLGHLKMDIGQLDEMLDRWSLLCDSITISVGGEVSVDFVEDLKVVSGEDLSNLLVRTEEPTTVITLCESRAEFSYSDQPGDKFAVDGIRDSLMLCKIRTPYYRLWAFWAWVYGLIITVAAFVAFGIQGTYQPPMPRVSRAYLLPPPPPPIPPIPPVFSLMILAVTGATFILLTVWFIYSLEKLTTQSSTRITRKKKYQIMRFNSPLDK
jgi:hypothetical protein